jgi:glycopeptide antibiotics resistance protein
LIIALFVGLFAYVLFKRNRIGRETFVALPLLAFYLSFVITITIIERQPSDNAQYNLLLFWSYRAIARCELDLISQVLWNVVLFIPIGILITLILKSKYKWLIAITISTVLSALIEVIQLFLHRGLFEFDDIFHNMLGAAIGICLTILVVSLKNKLSNKY